MSQTIPNLGSASTPHSGINAGGSSPQLLTPSSTPPPSATPNHGFIEQRLSNLLASMDSGTHSFCREDRDGFDERMMFPGVALPTPPASRRPSFLSGLSLTKPQGLQQLASSTPIGGGNNGALSTSFPKDAFAHFSMTRVSDDTAVVPPKPSTSSGPSQPEKTQRSKSVSVPKTAGIAGLAKADLINESVPAPAIGRAKTEGQILQRQVGFDSAAAVAASSTNPAQRHFDPSKEPRLFGLL